AQMSDHKAIFDPVRAALRGLNQRSTWVFAAARLLTWHRPMTLLPYLRQRLVTV
ncbi:MAG: hypothetical protein LQ341_005389, partial [Variospora aurantia]